MFESVYFKPSLYKKDLKLRKDWNAKNPGCEVFVPSHIKKLFTKYKDVYDDLNKDGSLFGVKDDMPKSEFEGVYVGPLNCEHDMEELSGKVFDWIPIYGVCDNASQAVKYIKDACQKEIFPGSKYVLILSPIFKENQPPQDGWRWCKWGPYIGSREKSAEYLVDEDEIGAVLVFSVCRVMERMDAQ